MRDNFDEFEQSDEKEAFDPVEEGLLPEEVYYSVLELLSYAQATGHNMDNEDSTVPSVLHVCRLADEGDEEAQFLASRYFLMNSSDEKDIERAVTWLEAAVDAGHERALAFLKELQEE